MTDILSNTPAHLVALRASAQIKNLRRAAALLGAALLLLALPAAAQAQSPGDILANIPSDEEATARVDEMMPELSERLGLTDAQAQALHRPLVESAHEQMALLRDFREEHGTDPGFFAKRSLRGDMKDLNKKRRHRLSGVLSEEQVETYERFAEKWRKERRAETEGGS